MYSAILANVANFTMDLIFIFGLGWGVAGAALATSFSQYVGVAAMLVLLHRRRILDFSDLRIVPSLSDIAPLLWVSLLAGDLISQPKYTIPTTMLSIFSRCLHLGQGIRSS